MNTLYNQKISAALSTLNRIQKVLKKCKTKNPAKFLDIGDIQTRFNEIEEITTIWYSTIKNMK